MRIRRKCIPLRLSPTRNPILKWGINHQVELVKGVFSRSERFPHDNTEHVFQTVEKGGHLFERCYWKLVSPVGKRHFFCLSFVRHLSFQQIQCFSGVDEDDGLTEKRDRYLTKWSNFLLIDRFHSDVNVKL